MQGGWGAGFLVRGGLRSLTWGPPNGPAAGLYSLVSVPALFSDPALTDEPSEALGRFSAVHHSYVNIFNFFSPKRF